MALPPYVRAGRIKPRRRSSGSLAVPGAAALVAVGIFMILGWVAAAVEAAVEIHSFMGIHCRTGCSALQSPHGAHAYLLSGICTKASARKPTDRELSLICRFAYTALRRHDQDPHRFSVHRRCRPSLLVCAAVPACGQRHGSLQRPSQICGSSNANATEFKSVCLF